MDVLSKPYDMVKGKCEQPELHWRHGTGRLSTQVWLFGHGWSGILLGL